MFKNVSNSLVNMLGKAEAGNDFIIKEEIFRLVDFRSDIEISYEEYDGVKVDYDGEKAVIGYDSKSNLARAYFLLALNISKSDKPFHIWQKRHFKTLGVSLDVARGGAPTVEAIKEYIVKMAALGYNLLTIYLEDMFELKEYPRFGYMRGRYSLEELKEIDDFGHQFGVEVVPGFETLGHMEQYLQWQEADPVRNGGRLLLVDNEKTYEFIECIVKTLRSTFRTNRIYAYMDEAEGLNLGRYMKIHGIQDEEEVFFRHLRKVISICEKYYFKPAVPLDMVFRFASKTNAYYDLDVVFPRELLERIPKNMNTVAWSYSVTNRADMERYGDAEGYYRLFLNKHRELCPTCEFFTAIWCWEGFFEDTEFTIDSSVPAMRNAVKNHFEEIIVTTWGDQGTETNIIKQTPSTLPIYSEYCFRGLECTMDDIIEVSTYLTKMPYQNKINLMNKMHGDFHDCQKINKSLIYGDILYNLIDLKYDYSKVSADYKEGAALCRQYIQDDPRNKEYYHFCLLSFEIGILKLDLLENLRKKYLERDMEYLKKAVYEYIPDIIKNTNEFYNVFQKNWDETNKSFGSENGQIRLGGVVRRAEYVAKRIEKYINGEISKLEELEQEVLLSERETYNHGFRKNTTANISGIV